LTWTGVSKIRRSGAARGEKMSTTVHVVCECKYLSDLAATRVGAGPGVYAIITARFGPLTSAMHAIIVTANMHAIIDSYQTPLMAYRDQIMHNEWRERTKHLSPPSAQRRARRPRNAGNRPPRRRIIP